GNQDHICAAGDARAERQPAGIVPHHLDNNDPVVAVGGAVQAVDGFGGRFDGAVVTDRRVGEYQVVVDGQRQGDHVQPLLHEVVGRFLSVRTPDQHQPVEVVLFVDIDHSSSLVADDPVDLNRLRVLA